MDRTEGKSADVLHEKIVQLGKIFPECLTEMRGADGKLKPAFNAELLKDILSGRLPDGNEAYQFTWVGKNAARAEAYRRVDKTLRPCVEESVDWNDTRNLYIEGDNLDVLKLLQQSYMNKVKLIYIDPPYNTGHDFIYCDRFEMEEEEYEAAIDLYDDVGNKNFVENSESNPRFHSDWCSMIYSRLLLARNLLTDDGVIFISIDDNEQANLKKICDEVFGDENFVALIPWRKRVSKSDVPHGLSQDYEWIVCYAQENFRAARSLDRKYFETEDFPNRPWRYAALTTQRTASERPNSFFTMVNPKTGEEFPASRLRTWAITKETFQEYYAADKIIFPGDYPFLKISKPVFRYWKADDMAKAGADFGKGAVSTKLPEEVGMSQDGTKIATEIFGAKVFGFPKPVELIKFLLQVSTDSSSLVLDFFSGSSTTAHAVMQLNAEDGGNRRFIMVQLPETCAPNSEAAKSGYKNICEIGKERIRRAGAKIKAAAPLTTEHLDVGFRVFKLDESNFKNVFFNVEEITQESLESAAENIKSDRTPLDLLFGCLLDWGVELNLSYTSEVFNGATIHNYADGALIACFDNEIDESVSEYIAKKKPLRAVFRDAGFSSDAAKLNADEIFKLYSPNTSVKVI